MSTLWLLLVISLAINTGWAEQALAQDPSSIQVDQPLYFVSPDGGPYLLEPGAYTVEPAPPWLRILPEERRDAILIEAIRMEHEESLAGPVPLIINAEDGTVHLLLLLPDGQGFEAVGSPSGIQSRATLRTKFSQVQIKQALTAKRLSSPRLSLSPVPAAPKTTRQPELFENPQVQMQGSPPVPILDQPAPNASLANPPLSFRWHPPSPNPAQTRYQLCVAEAGAGCENSQDSIVFKTLEAAAQTGTAQYELGVGPLAGQSMSSNGTPITAPRYEVKLPIRFQGKRLLWSVKACAPNPKKPVFSGGTAESCSQSDSRTLLWPLPAPRLGEPRHASVLETLRPAFKWDYEHLNGVDHFLLCLSKPGMACTNQPATTDDTIVVQVPITAAQSQKSYTPQNDWTLLRSGLLHWTVAACNHIFGCTYQQSVRQISLARPPAPTLVSPTSTMVLGLTNYSSNGNPRPEHPVAFTWQSVPSATLYRICLAPAGGNCGPPPGPSPESEGTMYRVGETQGTNLTLQLPNDLWWDYEQGIRFQWTVSACNSVGMCAPSAPRSIQFKVSRHSFSNLYPTFQNSKCTNCHGMANHNAKYLQHVRENRFPANTNPSNSQICANCHRAANGFADNWKAPSADLDWTGKTYSETCSMIRRGATHTQKAMKEHLLTDELVTWAVRHLTGNPVVNFGLWAFRVTNWLHNANQYEYPAGRAVPYSVRCSSLPIGK